MCTDWIFSSKNRSTPYKHKKKDDDSNNEDGDDYADYDESIEHAPYLKRTLHFHRHCHDKGAIVVFAEEFQLLYCLSFIESYIMIIKNDGDDNMLDIKAMTHVKIERRI